MPTVEATGIDRDSVPKSARETVIATQRPAHGQRGEQGRDVGRLPVADAVGDAVSGLPGDLADPVGDQRDEQPAVGRGGERTADDRPEHGRSAAGSTEKACEIANLPAAYALHGNGYAAGMPFAMIGRVVFRGDGKLSGANTEVWNGTVDNATYEGTYSIASTCRGVAKFVEKHENPATPNLHRLAFVIVAGGQRAFWTLTDNSYTDLGENENPLPVDTITVSGVAERMESPDGTGG